MFYTNIWDPWLILAQIAVLQCIFYIGVGVWLLVFSITFGTSISLHAILAPTQLQMVQGVGWPPIGAFLLVAPIIGVALLRVVGRAKQCLDFAATLYLIHFFLCAVYQRGMPTNWEWWGINTVACILCVVLGEYLCLQKELEAIPMTSEERESRERRATAQHALNVAAERARELDAHEPHERMTLMADVDSDREGGITTTTIRLTPNNVFNV